MNEEMNLQNAQTPSLNIADVRRSADMWWKTLNRETKVKYATLHAQRIAEKMVEDMRQKLFSMRSSKEPMYRLSEADRLMMYGYHDCINEMLMWTKPREI